MKNDKTLYVEFKSVEDMERSVLNATKTKIPKIQPKNILYFDSLSSFRNFMSLQKLELLTMIATESPKSIYELTQLVDRGLAAVQKDCQVLELAGFIKLDKPKGKRGSIAPKLKFDYNRIVVRKPEHSFAVLFEAA